MHLRLRSPRRSAYGLTPRDDECGFRMPFKPLSVISPILIMWAAYVLVRGDSGSGKRACYSQFRSGIQKRAGRPGPYYKKCHYSKVFQHITEKSLCFVNFMGFPGLIASFYLKLRCIHINDQRLQNYHRYDNESVEAYA